MYKCKGITHKHIHIYISPNSASRVIKRIKHDRNRKAFKSVFSGTSLLRSPSGLGKSEFNGEVTLLQGVICTVEYNLGLNQGDCNGEVFLLVR